MPSAKVHSYTAHVGLLGQLGSDRLIVIRHQVGEGAKPSEAVSEIYFADRFGASTSGYTTLGSAQSVRAHLPADGYADWIDLLRHEDPVFLHWSEADTPGEPEADGIIHLSTGPEPTGEGPVDMSPHNI